jgi:hypothetical protein
MKEDTYRIGEMPMISGSGEVEVRRFKRIDCKAGVWLVALQDNEADHVYFHNPKDHNSDGFAGRTLQFELEDGSIYSAKGPWKAGPDNLFRDTGYDCRQTHRIMVVIGRKIHFEDVPRSIFGHIAVISDIVYRDPVEGALGHFYRYKQLMADLPDGEYQYYSESQGGSVRGSQVVDNWWRSEIKAGRFNPDRPIAKRA